MELGNAINIALQHLNNKDFSYVSLSWYDVLFFKTQSQSGFSFKHIDFVVLSKNKKRALELVKTFLNNKFPLANTDEFKIHIYPSNYIKESKRMVLEGRFIPQDDTSQVGKNLYNLYRMIESEKILAPAAAPSEDISVVMPETPEIPTESKPLPNQWINDNWYKNHPDKILGVPVPATDRFKRPTTRYKGSLADLEKIDIPDMGFLSANESPVGETIISTNEININDAGVRENIQTAISTMPQEMVVKTKVRKSGKQGKKISILADLDADQVDFIQSFKKLNPDISQAELEVFIWYKKHIGQPLNDNWTQLVNGQEFTELHQEQWVKNQHLFYFRGSLLPAYLYFSGNIWERKSALSNDREQIIEKFGGEVYEKQLQLLSNVFQTTYAQRSTFTDPDESKRIMLKPISKFANEQQISFLTDEKPFKMKAVGVSSSKHYGRPDFLYNGYISDYKKTTFETLSLTEAFQYFLVNYKNEYEIKKDTTYAEIMDIYIRQANMPSIGPDPTPEQLKAAQTAWQRKKNLAQLEGDRLFSYFLANFIKLEDQVRIETLWNEKYKGFLPVNLNKIPIGFRYGKTYRGEVVDVRQEKRDGVAFIFNEGSGCIAYDVGVGKTWTAIFTIAQFMDSGYCKRPFLVVPNQTYKQWIVEVKGLMPGIKINDLYNLSEDYISELRGADNTIQPVDEYSVSIMTYEGFERIGFNENTSSSMLSGLYDILDQGEQGYTEKQAAKKQAMFFQKLETLVGRGLQGTMVNVEDLGFDFVCYDEAHKMKKVFTGVKGEIDKKSESGKREKSPYKIVSGGEPSSIALKGFMISHYIQKKNNGRNVVMLTATPFTNSPLEIYSVLSFIASKHLAETDMTNLKAFFDVYVNTVEELVINAKLKPERKQVVKGFNNLQSLQQLIRRFILYKTGEEVKVKRPNKFVLPLKNKNIDGQNIPLLENERVGTNLPLSTLQQRLMDDIKEYASGNIGKNQLCSDNTPGVLDSETGIDDDGSDATEGVELDEGSLSSDEKVGVRILRAMNFARNLALSPYLYDCSGLGSVPPTPADYILTSPKLHYVTECIRSVKKYHEDRNTPISGQVIYMDRGIAYFKYIRQYLIDEIGFKPHEVVMIYSGMPGGKDAKENIKNQFLGLRYDRDSGEHVDIPDADRAKVLIGSGTIKEGINLQRHSSVLYDCFLDWNPTDMKQLEGRIWRQGNMFNNVRIVLPLMEDSLDVFIFQKLEEKTARISDIWDTGGQSNTFNLEEFNPSELKNELISDPKVLAEMQLIEDRERVNDDKRAVNNEINKIDNILEANHTVNEYTNKLQKLVEEYRPVREGQTRSLKSLIGILQDVVKSQTDAQGRKMAYGHERKYGSGIEYSDKYPLSKPYYMDDLVSANRILERAERDYLIPKNLTLEGLPAYKQHLEKEIERLSEVMQETVSEKRILARAEEIIRQRSENKYVRKAVPQRVAEFETLNYLLDDVFKRKSEPKLLIDQCPPMKDGQRLIDSDSLEQMDRCIASQPQTKELNTLPNGDYTDVRKKLHEKIINEFRMSAKCVKQSQPIAVLTGGPPGSGKTTFLKNRAKWLLSDNVFHIDADAVRSKLPEYKGWNANSTHLETKDIVNQMIDSVGIPCEYDLVYDGTMNKAKNYFPLINRLKNLGYKVFIIYMTVPKEISVERALGRYQRSGRYVPMEVINEVFDFGTEAFNKIKTLVSGYIVVDGINYDIIESGGEKIPEDRKYQLDDGTALKPAKQKASDVKSGIKKAIAGLNILLKLSEKNENKSDIRSAIAGLKTLLKI